MRRVTRDELSMRLTVALSVSPTYKQRALGITTESAREALMQELVKRIMGPPESEAVILEPSNAGPIHAPWRGKWDVDEPHPMELIENGSKVVRIQRLDLSKPWPQDDGEQ